MHSSPRPALLRSTTWLVALLLGVGLMAMFASKPPDTGGTALALLGYAALGLIGGAMLLIGVRRQDRTESARRRIE